MKSQIFGILEYAHEKVLITVYPSTILIIEHWMQIHTIEDPRFGNDQKYFITPLPNFHCEEFPFLVSSGYETLNLINVRDHRTEVLIKAPVRNVKSQQAIFFRCPSSRQLGFYMHFSTLHKSDYGSHFHGWYSMQFRQDFIEELRDCG